MDLILIVDSTKSSLVITLLIDMKRYKSLVEALSDKSSNAKTTRLEKQLRLKLRRIRICLDLRASCVRSNCQSGSTRCRARTATASSNLKPGSNSDSISLRKKCFSTRTISFNALSSYTFLNSKLSSNVFSLKKMSDQGMKNIYIIRDQKNIHLVI